MSTSPSRQLETFANPQPGRDYIIRFRPLRDGIHPRCQLPRDQVVEAIPLVLPQRGRISRGGNQPDPRRPGGRLSAEMDEGDRSLLCPRGNHPDHHRRTRHPLLIRWQLAT